MTVPTRWALGIAVVALAIIAILLPRQDPATSATPSPNLDSARVGAALSPCLSGSGRPQQLDQWSGERSSEQQILPEMPVVCLADGQPIDLATALAGQSTLVNFWATWCGPCQTELPVLAEYARQPGAMRVLTVQVASPVSDGLELLTKLGVRLPTVHDGEGQQGPVRAALDVPQALPATILVAADGQAKLITNPRVFHEVAQVRAAVDEAA